MTGQECIRAQVALRHSRYGGLPTVNVENACASGSSAVFMDSYAQRRIAAHGWTPADFAAVVVKNRRHAVHNPGAQFRQPMTAEQVVSSRMISEPLTLPIGDGAAALEVDVIEVHDATASAELEAYEHLGLAAAGEGNRPIAEGLTLLSGTLPVNSNGGHLSRGHPVGATGVLQIVELVTQLRGEADGRQASPTQRLALAQNAGGFVEGDNTLAVVMLLERKA
jgi:acetyl-CoA acyltransferase